MKAVEEAFIPHIGWLSHERGDELIWLLRQGYFEAAEQAFYWLYLRPGDWFFDCGAHIGLYSITADRATSGKVHILSVEAANRTADCLVENLQKNDVHGARVIRRALWSSTGTVWFDGESVGKSAYAHVVFGDSSGSFEVETITLDELVDLTGEKGVINLVKIDIEGAEPEALEGGVRAFERKAFPVIMIEFTEQNLHRRGWTTERLASQLQEMGYELCEFSAEKLELIPFQANGPIWYKNLFACLDRSKVNLRLNTANNNNRVVARDILERAHACHRFKELEDLEHYRRLANRAEEFQIWASNTEALLAQERAASQQMLERVEKAEHLLLQERELSQQLRTWVENAEARFSSQKELSQQLRTWAENAEARVQQCQAKLIQMEQLLTSAQATIEAQEARIERLTKELEILSLSVHSSNS